MAPTKKHNDDPWSSSDDDEEDDDSDDENIELDAEIPFYSICSYCHTDASTSPKFDTLALALDHDTNNYGFDFLATLLKCNIEGDEFFEGAIVLINKSRQFIKDNQAKFSGKELGQELNNYIKDHKFDDENDMQYYKPVLVDDSMLMCIDELCDLTKRQSEQESQADNMNMMSAAGNKAEPESDHKMEQLQSQISMLEGQLARAKEYIAALANDDDDDKRMRMMKN